MSKRKEDWRVMRDMWNAGHAAWEDNGSRLSYEELAKKLGVETKDGNIDLSELAQACLNVLDNPRYEKMKPLEQQDLLRSVADALSILMPKNQLSGNS